MASFLIHLISSADSGRFSSNEPGDYITRLDTDIFVPVGSKMACQELNFQCTHEQNEKEAKIEVIDWLYEHKPPKPKRVKLSKTSDPPVKPTPPPPTTSSPIPTIVSKSKFGLKTEVSLGSSIDLPNGEALCASLNYHIAKALPRMKKSRFKIFSFDRAQNTVYVSFPPLPYFYTLNLHSKTLELCGMEERAKKSDYTLIGQSKPADHYFITRDIKGQKVREKRYFIDSLKKELESKEEIHSYFLLPPKLSSQHSIYLYCDCIEDQIVSNSRAPLLRIVPLVPTTRRVTQNFGSSLQFVPLRTTTLRQLRIWMRDMWGNPIPFNSYTRLTLIIQPPSQPGQ